MFWFNCGWNKLQLKLWYEWVIETHVSSNPRYQFHAGRANHVSYQLIYGEDSVNGAYIYVFMGMHQKLARYMK